MIIYLIVILIVLICIISMIKHRKNSDSPEYLTGVGFFCFAITAFIVMSLIWINMPTKKELFKSNYYNTKAVVESIKKQDSNFNYRNESISEVTYRVLNINDQISNNKAYSKNLFVNIWYSEEIGNYKPLTL